MSRITIDILEFVQKKKKTQNKEKKHYDLQYMTDGEYIIKDKRHSNYDDQ